MTITSEDIGGVHVLHLTGDLTGDPEQPLVAAVSALLAEARTRIVLDLAGLKYVNSAGLGDLVRLAAQSNVQEARLVLAAPAAYLAGVLETTRLDRFFELRPTVDEAVAALSQ